MKTYQVYIPSDMIAIFPKVAETFPEGDVWVDMMPSSERNTPLWEAAEKKAKHYGLWVRVLWPNSSFHCIHRGLRANKPSRIAFKCPAGIRPEQLPPLVKGSACIDDYRLVEFSDWPFKAEGGE